MTRLAVILLAVGCVNPTEGEACSYQHDDTYDTVCRDGELFRCDGGVWVDLGTEWGKDPLDTAVLAAPECHCSAPNRASCSFYDF